MNVIINLLFCLFLGANKPEQGSSVYHELYQKRTLHESQSILEYSRLEYVIVTQ